MRISLDVEKILKQIRASEHEFCEARPETLRQKVAKNGFSAHVAPLPMFRSRVAVERRMVAA